MPPTTPRHAAKPQPLTLEQAAWITPPMQAEDTEGMIDVPRMRRYRQNRLRAEIVKQGLDAVILIEPVSAPNWLWRTRASPLRRGTGARPGAQDQVARGNPGDEPDHRGGRGWHRADALRNGVMEQEPWALMWQALIEGGGQWLDYRLLASGERTPPGSRKRRAG